MKRKYVNKMVDRSSWKDTVKNRNRVVFSILLSVFIVGVAVGSGITALVMGAIL